MELERMIRGIPSLWDWARQSSLKQTTTYLPNSTRPTWFRVRPKPNYYTLLWTRLNLAETAAHLSHQPWDNKHKTWNHSQTTCNHDPTQENWHKSRTLPWAIQNLNKTTKLTPNRNRHTTTTKNHPYPTNNLGTEFQTSNHINQNLMRNHVKSRDGSKYRDRYR